MTAVANPRAPVSAVTQCATESIPLWRLKAERI